MNLLRKCSCVMISVICLSAISSCNFFKKSDSSKTVEPITNTPVVSAPAFNADTAYALIKTQVDMGPRNPNTKAHEQCAKWMIEYARKYADTVYVQKYNVTAFEGTVLHSTNVIASFNPMAKTRILICSHWDCRPWADQDTINRNQPILAANDAGSGVGIMLEMCRAIHSMPTDIGVDLFMIDAEDYGYSSSLDDIVHKKGDNEDSYCLGTQYWGKNPHTPGYKADFGILLDMVGSRNAVFTREQTSAFHAGWVLDKVWANGQTLGYSGFFSNEKTGGLTDDHLYINKLTGIPTIDIIHYTGAGFGYYWHTHADNMDIIDKISLEAVGKTLLYTIYQYAAEKKSNS